MSTVNVKGKIERDCTEKCRSAQHGDKLSSAISKRDVTDAELCAFINWQCSASGQVNDTMGRSAIHYASSCGRTKLLKWLTKKRNADINAKDLESGYTALHRSIFYGKINAAVTLIKLGANINLLDHNDLSPIDHAMKDRLNNVQFTLTSCCQAYVWGTNTNYSLGTGYQHSKQLPDLHDAFHKKYTDVSVAQVCVAKFHSILLSKDGRVFSCGHGTGGRLGLNSEKTVLIPQEIYFSNSASTRAEKFACVQASIGRDHSIFLSETGQVWTCGLNTHHVLGIKPPPSQLLIPRPVVHLSELRVEFKGICAGRFHSIAWGSNAVYSWGLHAGQLGHDQLPNDTTYIVLPKLLANKFLHKDTEIVYVAASDGATVVATNKGDVFLFHEYQCRKIASKQFNIGKVIVVGGHLNSKVNTNALIENGGSELKIVVLQTTGNLLLWQESWPQLSRCIYTLKRPLIVNDAILSRKELFFVTNDGEAFQGVLQTRKKRILENADVVPIRNKTAFHEFLEKDECQIVKVTKLPHIHRAVSIHCDLKGQNFAIIQNAPQCLLVDIPEISISTMRQDLLNLLYSTDEMDTIHDVIFKVSGHTFPVHRYIIALKSGPLDHLIESNNSKDATIELTNIHPIIFKQILIYIYTGTCDLLTSGECLLDITSTNNDTKDPVRLLQQSAKRFDIKSLYKKLDNYSYANGCVHFKCKKESSIEVKIFDRSMYNNLHDVIIQSKNGAEIGAHKCILAARLEYFNNLFAPRWSNQSLTTATTTKTNIICLPIKHSVLESIIDFLYTDDVKQLKNTDDIDYIFDVLIVSDQLFIDKLKEICELSLSSLLTLKNVSYMLQKATIYNSMKLKRCCMEFICLNLTTVLETRILDILDDDVLNDLTGYYCDWNKILCKRVITPYSDAPSDDIVKTICECFPVNIEDLDDFEQENVDDKKITSKLNIRKNVRRRKSSSSSISSKHSVMPLTSPPCNTNQISIIEEENKTDQKLMKTKNIIQMKLHDDDKNYINFTKFRSSRSITSTNTPSNKASVPGASTTFYDYIKTSFSPKSPWQNVEGPSSPASPETKEQLLDIIVDERKRKQNWTKMRTRPFTYTQMEDKAISDLERFYNIDQVSDECITIHKVENYAYGVPLWVHHK